MKSKPQSMSADVFFAEICQAMELNAQRVDEHDVIAAIRKMKRELKESIENKKPYSPTRQKFGK